MAKKQCDKKRYATRAQAEAAIAGMARRFGLVAYKKAYWCGKCRAFHVTSRPWRGTRRVKH